MNENIDKYKSKKIEIIFNSDTNKLFESIKKFGHLEKENKDETKYYNKQGKLLNKDDINLLIEWIKSDDKQINKVKFELCYDAKQNGDDKDNFHKFCDNVGPSLLIVKTESNYIFGGYTKENWENNNNSKYDDTAFLFSLNNKERLKIKNPQKAIVNDSSYGPIFGHGNAYEICLFYPFLSNSIQICEGGDYGNKDLLLTGKKSKKPIEIELYKVKF